MRGGVERALGHTSAVAQAPEVQTRFVLMGVIAADSGRGSALIALDGQPPQAYIQGQMIEPGWTLKTVSPDAVTLQGVGGLMNLVLKN
jgi:general secretion pathway protein C